MRTPLFILGVALALVAFIAMFTFGLLFANHGSNGPSLKVVVATRDIAAREVITPDMVTITSIPSTGVPSHAFVHASDLAGYWAVVPIYKGQVLSDNLVASNANPASPQLNPFLTLQPGQVAITLPSSELQGVGGYPEPGDYIKVMAAVNTALFSPIDPRPATATVFHKIQILKVGPASAVPGAVQQVGVTSSITVAMTVCDAQYMDWFLSNATLKYALISHDDTGNATDPAPDPSCSSPTFVVGPKAVEARWGFLQA
jgi:Flp pilus assembly protein CpaB